MIAPTAGGRAASLPATTILEDPLGFAYPLQMRVGWPLNRQRIRLRDRRGRTILRMVLHLARPAYCKVHAGDEPQPCFRIEAERFYGQSRVYRILDRKEELFGWIEYLGKVSMAEATFKIHRRTDTRPAFVIHQIKAGADWLDRLVGTALSEVLGLAFRVPEYAVAGLDGSPLMRTNLREIERSIVPINRNDELLCLLALSVVAIAQTGRGYKSGTV